MAGCGPPGSWLLWRGPDFPPIPGRLCLVLLLLVLLSYPPPSWTISVPVTSSAMALPRTGPSKVLRYHIGAMFEVDDVSAYITAFQTAVNNTPKNNGVEAHDVILESLHDVRRSFHYVCDAIHNNNITVFVAVGSQNMINILSIVTKYLGIPVVGYNTDRKRVAVRGERPLYLQFDPSKSLIARALAKTLHASSWYYASILVEDHYATDGFLQTFRRLTEGEPWRIEDQIILSNKLTTEAIDYKLHALLENQSRVLILHASAELARRVFQVARQNGFTHEGYAWFVSEDVISKHEQQLKDYPIGLVAFAIDYDMDYKNLLQDAVTLVSKATNRFMEGHGNKLLQYVKKNACYTTPTAEQYKLMDSYYRYLKHTQFAGKTGNVSFDEDGLRAEVNFRILNLVQKTRGGNTGKRWKVIGSYRNDTFKISTIVWPGNTVSGPITMGERTLRVVTNVVPPFVMEAQALQRKCPTAVPCLRVQTRDKERLDDIFKDFENGVTNSTNPYEVRCCQGFSVMLLERLARDLNFRQQLYIVADEKYGFYENSSWNGLVQDLMQGAAHMAIAAFSITKSRSKVIDFTDPFFFSGFSILVSERKRETPIYAFMEPFDGWVWVSIVISATVVAVAVSLQEWNSPFGLNPWGRKRKVNYTFGSALNMVYAIFFQHTVKTKSPKSWPAKWIQNFWAGASIFIYSSYTANLAAFLAGKNSGVTITGIHDPKLMELPRIGMLASSSVQTYLAKIDVRLYNMVRRHPVSLSYDGIHMLLNETIHAYLDDTPVLEYARTTMDAKCQLRLVGEGFGEDGYGIGLPKGSWLKLPLSRKILEYHESGFIDDLKDLYFRRNKCNDNSNDGQLQGEASPMNFNQHAGLYLLLIVGIFVCIILMLLEHATFKWLVPYWRGKPNISFWKSYSMMFWSQRLYRIITSEELVSPHHSAREMIEVVKNRDFTKLFQKSVKKQERQARNRKNLFSVVEQLQWKQRREERLSQHPSLQTDCSQDSDNSATPVNVNRRHCKLDRDDAITTDTNDDPADDWPPNWEKEWIADDEDADCLEQEATSSQMALYKAGHVNQSFSSQAELVKLNPSYIQKVPMGRALDDSPIRCTAKMVDERPSSRSTTALNLIDYSIDDLPVTDTEDESQMDKISPGMPLLGNTSTSEDNILTGAQLPNGVLILSPNGDVFARDVTSGKNILVRPKTFANFKNFTTNLPQSMKTLPLKDNRVKSNILSRSRTLDRLNEGTITNDIDPGGGEPGKVNLDSISKEQLFYLWKTSEKELNQRLRDALEEKAKLEQKLAIVKPDLDT